MYLKLLQLTYNLAGSCAVTRTNISVKEKFSAFLKFLKNEF